MAGRRYNRLMHAARQEVERNRSASELGSDPVAILQEVLDGAVADLRYAQTRVDELPEDQLFRDSVIEGRVPSEWVNLRDKYRAELERMCNSMVRAGIADRAVQIREAEAVLMIGAIQQAALDIGLDGEQVRELGAALRQRFQDSRASAPALPVIDAVAEEEPIE